MPATEYRAKLSSKLLNANQAGITRRSLTKLNEFEALKILFTFISSDHRKFTKLLFLFILFLVSLNDTVKINSSW